MNLYTPLAQPREGFACLAGQGRDHDDLLGSTQEIFGTFNMKSFAR